MRSKLPLASGIAVAMTMSVALVTAQTTGASAEELTPQIIEAASEPTFVSEPVVQEIPAQPEETASDQDVTEQASVPAAGSLRQLVSLMPHIAALPREMRCLAGAIYFEARGESLAGQLAVGRVIIERAKSSRFPDNYCGVVFQRSQFSFVRGGRMPKIREQSKAWKRAVAIAQIAHEGSWESPAEGAMFFHATHVSPRWRLTRIARIDNHIFYR